LKSESPVRVLQLVLSLKPGGTERLVVELVRRLNPEIPMAVCCLDEPGAWASELATDGVAVDALGRRDGFHPSLGRLVARAARRHHAAIIHCHHYSPLVYGSLASLLRPGTRVVFTEHGRLSDAAPSRKRRVANALFARIPKASFAVSGDLREHLIAEGFAPDRLGVIYNGIDVGPAPRDADRASARSRLSLDARELVVGTIARLDPVKDLGTLIRAVAEVALARPITLLVVGDGPERAALERVASELACGTRVRFVGHRDDARAWLPGCDVYANSSISEGVSLTLLEAMAAGLPIVATRVGGTPEVVDDSCARLVEARSPGRLAEALAGLARDPEGRRRLGAAARARVVERFTLDRMVREYRDVYRKVA
jgi:glycosyltransferase involved in cell wall biosynthesis